MMVWVANYEHKHGNDLNVFLTEAAADEWAISLAEEYWDDMMDGEAKPVDRKKLSQRYWEFAGDVANQEWLSIQGYELDVSVHDLAQIIRARGCAVCVMQPGDVFGNGDPDEDQIKRGAEFLMRNGESIEEDMCHRAQDSIGFWLHQEKNDEQL